MNLLLSFLLVSTSAFATKDFSVFLKRGTESEWIRVTPRGKLWECATNTVPAAETPGNPLKNLNWVALEKEARRLPKNCDQTVKINNDLEGQDQVVTTCLSQPATKSLYDTMSGNCRDGF